MKNRYFAICLCLLATLLLFSGCGGGGNSILGGHISFINDSNPFVGTWICATTKQDNPGAHVYRYDKLVFTTEKVTLSYIDVVDYGLTTQHTVELSAEGTWYFLNDGCHIYIKPTKYNNIFISPTASEDGTIQYDTADVINTRTTERNNRYALNQEIHYTYAMNEGKTQFSISNVAAPSQVWTWDRW